MVLLNPKVQTILQTWHQGHSPCDQDYAVLLSAALEHPGYVRAFELDADKGLTKIQTRAQQFIEICPQILSLCEEHRLASVKANLRLLWHFWLPTAMQLAEARTQKGLPLVQGILGGQGTGKTTLAAMLQCILAQLGYTSLALSIDDLYKTYADRQLLQQQDPRLIWRGPPGTHDVAIGIEVIDQMCHGEGKSVAVPRFNKSAFNGAGDRTTPELVAPADIILFEGWFLGTRPVATELFDQVNQAPSPIDCEADCDFARAMNERLKEYLPLWERLDRLMVLYPVDYRFSKVWRQEAEAKMKATGKAGMSDAEIDAFVDYFWRSLHPELFITPLTQNPELVDLVVEIDANHAPQHIYKPG